MNMTPTFACVAGLLTLTAGIAQAQQDSKMLPPAPGPTPQPAVAAASKPAPPPKSNRRRYDVRQTFDGGSYEKDNHVWVYDRDFAELFGMPEKYIEPIVGAVAAAYRIEDLGYQLCGLGGADKNCMPTEVCRLDLYFDETKTPLPWATEVRQQWEPEHASLRWLKPMDRRERPAGMTAVEAPAGLIRNTSYARIVAFADPTTKREAHFTINGGFADLNKVDPESVSGWGSLAGYSRQFYQSLSVVSLQYDCHVIKRRTVTVRLDVREDAVSDALVRFNRVTLPEGFVRRTNEVAAQREQRTIDSVRKALGPHGVLLDPTQDRPSGPALSTPP